MADDICGTFGFLILNMLHNNSLWSKSSHILYSYIYTFSWCIYVHFENTISGQSQKQDDIFDPTVYYKYKNTSEPIKRVYYDTHVKLDYLFLTEMMAN